MTDCDVAILGAGPYGLAVAAHLSSPDMVVFGRPMSFWREHMPAGMRLRSPREASHLSAPKPGLSLDDYERGHGLQPAPPTPLERFVDYGLWFQRRAASQLDQRAVLSITKVDKRFELRLDDGSTATARAVVVAAGIQEFAWRPPEFASCPPELVSHSVDHDDLSSFAGQQVMVVGGGQSAVESAALLHEGGADVELAVRAPHLNWLIRSGWLHTSKLRRLLYAPSDIGPAGVSWLVALPGLFRTFPRATQDRLATRSIRPAASSWLAPRTKDVTMNFGRAISAVAVDGDRVKLAFDDGSVGIADHVLLATGYRVDITKYRFLPPELLAQIDRVNGYPRLRRDFESSVRGLYFVGAPAAWSSSPLLRFVAGTSYAAPRVARSLRARVR